MMNNNYNLAQSIIVLAYIYTNVRPYQKLVKKNINCTITAAPYIKIHIGIFGSW